MGAAGLVWLMGRAGFDRRQIAITKMGGWSIPSGEDVPLPSMSAAMGLIRGVGSSRAAGTAAAVLKGLPLAPTQGHSVATEDVSRSDNPVLEGDLIDAVTGHLAARSKGSLTAVEPGTSPFWNLEDAPACWGSGPGCPLRWAV